MNFGLSEEQELLQKTARDFFTAECPTSLIRELAANPSASPRDLYAKMAELGFTGLIVPEAHGGSGLSMLDLAIVAEEAGRAALPGPFPANQLAIVALTAGGGREQKKAWLELLGSGRATATVAIADHGDRADAAAIRARAKPTRRGFRIRGVKEFVDSAGSADVMVVAARTAGNGESGISLFLVPTDTPGVRIDPLDLVDLTRRAASVTFDDVEVPATAVLGKPGTGWRVASRTLDAAALLLAADSLGGAQRSLEMSVDYSKTREQFGRPIGSFQAVKHLAAEMVSEIEPARSLVWYAAYAFDSLRSDASRAAAMAKARLSDVYSRVANRAVQIHGGIGFTWEHDMHIWFKRAKANEFAHGDATHHRERLATMAFDE